MYAAKLQGLFPTLQFTVIPKADALFPIVSAASISAKVTRDVFMQEWQFGAAQKGLKLDEEFGSGYPSGKLVPRAEIKAECLDRSSHSSLAGAQLEPCLWLSIDSAAVLGYGEAAVREEGLQSEMDGGGEPELDQVILQQQPARRRQESACGAQRPGLDQCGSTLRF